MILSDTAIPAFGYVSTALLYFAAWLNPRSEKNEQLIRWVSFEKLCLTEFLSCHAITLLTAVALSMNMEGGEGLSNIFWGLIGLYALMGTAAYLFHRSHRALIGFYVVLVTRGIGFFSVQTADKAMLEIVLIKNFFMFGPTMLLIASIAFRPGEDSWQETFIRGRLSIAERFSQGRNLLMVTGFYLIWALVEWKWPRF